MSTSPERMVPLKVLICDREREPADALAQRLTAASEVLAVRTVASIDEAGQSLRRDDVNVIFIDPISLGLEPSSSFIFGVRQTLPEIVFVLYVDRARAENGRSEFFRGERQRFAHYFTLDKQTPVGSFAAEVEATIKMCQSDLGFRLSATSLQRLRDEASRQIADDTAGTRTLLNEVQSFLSHAVVPRPSPPKARTVFLSHRFAEEEYVAGLKALLEQHGFEVITASATHSHIGQSIITSIRESSLFLSLMTRADEKADGTYTTSSWLLEEKGVALALGKQLVIMVEDGVSDFGALQGDWQRIHFGPKGFLTAALQAVEQLRSYAGMGK